MNEKIMVIINFIVGVITLLLGILPFTRRYPLLKIVFWIFLILFILFLLIWLILVRKKTILWLFLKVPLKNPSGSIKSFLQKNVENFREKFNEIEKILEPEICRVKFVYDFATYCNKCKEMLSKSSNVDTILTIQTPVPMSSFSPQEDIAYTQYINYTCEKIISTDITYKRFVILKDNDIEPEIKIKKFVNDLITAAVVRETKNDINVDLGNTYIGFAHISQNSNLVYSNLDIHITTEKDFSVAFLSKTPGRRSDFGGSLHLLDFEKHVSAKLKEDITALWSEIERRGNYIEIGEYYPRFIMGTNPKNDAMKNKIIDEINRKIDEITKKIKTGKL